MLVLFLILCRCGRWEGDVMSDVARFTRRRASPTLV